MRYLNELLDIFEEEGVDTALWFCFANYDKPGDRDIASYGVVRMLDQEAGSRKRCFTPWRPGTSSRGEAVGRPPWPGGQREASQGASRYVIQVRPSMDSRAPHPGGLRGKPSR